VLVGQADLVVEPGDPGPQLGDAAVAAEDLLVFRLDLGQHGPGLGQLPVAVALAGAGDVRVGGVGRAAGVGRAGRVPLEVDGVEEQELGRPEPHEAEPIDVAAAVGQGLSQVLAAIEVGDGRAAPGVAHEVDPAARSVDEHEAAAIAGGVPAQGGDGPVGEAPAQLRVEAAEHRQGAVKGDRDRLSPVAVGQLLEAHVCRNIGRSVGSLQCTSRP